MLDDVRHPIERKGLPLGRCEKKLSRAVENPSTILLVRERSRHGQCAGHTREQRNGFPAPFLLGPGGDVVCHPADVRSQRLQEWSAYAARSSGYLGRERSHGTTAGHIVAMPCIEVRVDECLEFATRSGAFDRTSHAIRDFLKAELERFRKQPLFAVEVTIEASVCQTEVAHEIADARALTSAAAEPAGRRPDDALARLLLVIRGVAHS
jgi:hypothetical protein